VKRLLRTILPPPLVTRLREARTLPPDRRSTYLRLQAARLLGLRQDRLPSLPDSNPLVVFVCHGNIIRSPMAAALFATSAAARRSPPVRVVSAGLFAVPGRPADPRALRAAVEAGSPLESHRAQLLTRPLVDSATVLFVMDRLNEAELVCRFPDAAGRTLLLGAFARDPGSGAGTRDAAIDDPVEGTLDDVRACCRRIRSAVDAVVERWMSPGRPDGP
jgi:protein-tyrosine phosphatase